MRLDSASALFSFLELEEACLIWTPAPMFVTELLHQTTPLPLPHHYLTLSYWVLSFLQLSWQWTIKEAKVHIYYLYVQSFSPS